MISAGIDPGKKGALCVLDHHAMPVVLHRLPYLSEGLGFDGIAFDFMIDPWLDLVDIWVVENQTNLAAKPGKSSVHAVFQAMAYGALINQLRRLGVPMYEAEPSIWKRIMRVTADKETSVKRAEALYPIQPSIFRGPRGGLLDGEAEAFLLASYGRMLVRG